jgi:two-component system, sensor histidine kinase and response regulator
MTFKRLRSWRWWRRAATTPQPAVAQSCNDESHYAAAVTAREEAIFAARAKTTFLSNMSHELRSPMNAMLGMAELLAESPLSAEQRRYLDIIVGNGNALLGLVNDILDFARAESGHLKLETAEFDLIELMERVAEMLAPEAHRKGLELSVEVQQDIPVIALGDSRRLEQILMNLASNAIKFTPSGEITMVAGREPGSPGMIRISVIDTGIGIDASEHQRIFASYVQAVTRPSAPPGSGLGLAIVKQLAELMGGRVWVESEPGAGSSFHCALRLGYRPRANQGDEPVRRRALAECRLLLVGGMARSRAALAATLRACGATVEQVGSSTDTATAMTAAQPVDAVLIDLPAVESDCAGMIRAIKAALPDALPLIAMIPVHDRASRLAMLEELGLRHYVVKPARRADLIEVIGEAIGGGVKTARPGRDSLAPSVNSEASSRCLPPMRLLVVDDAEDNRILIEAYLRQSGCQLDLIGNGTEAIQHFRAQRYDAVLMDLHMPEMDGYEAIRQMRGWEQAQGLGRTPIIALTAAVLEDAVRESLEAGCDSHLSKPVKRSTLFNALREVAVRAQQASGE